MSPKVVKITPVRLGDRDRVVDAPHRDHAHRAARAVDELERRREQALEPVPVDRVGVPAAHLHHPHRLADRQERGDLGRQGVGKRRVAVLVHVPHVAASVSRRSSAIPA